MDDEALKQRVVDALSRRHGLDAAHIGITAESGVVTLTGSVPTLEQKYRVERLVKRVPGVQGIAEELRVRFAGAPSADDDEIARRALQALAHELSLPAESVKVFVEQGWVTLSGRLDAVREKQTAEAAVATVYGVAGIINEISVALESSPEDVVRQINEAVQRPGGSSTLRIGVMGGRVTLEGIVESPEARQEIVEAAWSAAGVFAVSDKLRIATAP